MREASFDYLENELYYQTENKSLINSNLLTDRQRNRLMDQVETIDRLYSLAHEDMQLFIKRKYMHNVTWSELAKELQISRKNCFLLRRMFIERVADELGII